MSCTIFLSEKSPLIIAMTALPLSAAHNCEIYIVFELSLNIRPLRFYTKSECKHKEAAPVFVAHSKDTVTTWVYLHATRVHIDLLPSLTGKISISVDASKLKRKHNIYVVPTLKFGEAYYLADINAKQATNAVSLAIQLQA